MGNLIKYGEYTEEAAQEEAQDLKRRSPYLKLPVGETVIRIPPPVLGATSPFIKASLHRVDVPGQQYPFKFPCPRVHHGKGCIVCREADRLRASQHRLDQDKARDLVAKTRYYCEVIDRADEASGWKVWEFGPRMMEDLNTLRRNKRGGGNFTDPETGFDLIITRVGTGAQDTRYNLAADRNSSPFGDMSLLAPDQRPDMSYFTRQVTEVEIESGLQGDAEEHDAAEPPVAPATTTSRSPTSSPRQATSPALSTLARKPARTAGDMIEGEVEDDALLF